MGNRSNRLKAIKTVKETDKSFAIDLAIWTFLQDTVKYFDEDLTPQETR